MKNTIKDALEDRSLLFRTNNDDESKTIYQLGMSMENGRIDVYIDIRSESDLVIIYVVSTVFVPANRRDLFSEFLTRANYGLLLENFEMDYSDGEVRYKCTFAYDETFPVSKDVFLRNLYVSVNTMDKYHPGIMSVVYANVPPSNAIAQIENVTDPSIN